MKDRLVAKLFTLQRKLQYISIYSHENGSILFKYSIEFEVLLGLLLKINYQQFCIIDEHYSFETQRFCELGCEFNEENNREKAFSSGKKEMESYIKMCIEILTG